MAFFLSDENISRHAGVKVPAGQCDLGSAKQWAVVGTDGGDARLLSGWRATDTECHNTTFRALKTCRSFSMDQVKKFSPPSRSRTPERSPRWSSGSPLRPRSPAGRWLGSGSLWTFPESYTPACVSKSKRRSVQKCFFFMFLQMGKFPLAFSQKLASYETTIRKENCIKNCFYQKHWFFDETEMFYSDNSKKYLVTVWMSCATCNADEIETNKTTQYLSQIDGWTN